MDNHQVNDPIKKFSINNVVKDDEFTPNVDDNAFTSGAAITALQFAVRRPKYLGSHLIPIGRKWLKISKSSD